MSAEAVVTALSTNLTGGLGDEEAVRRQRREGFNELPEAPPASPLKLFLSQFTSVIIWVLVGAAVCPACCTIGSTRRPLWPLSLSTVG